VHLLSPQDDIHTAVWTEIAKKDGDGDVDTLGPLNIRALEIFLGYASPCLMDLFIPKSAADFEYLPALQ
jgi:hypothetical protein